MPAVNTSHYFKLVVFKRLAQVAGSPRTSKAAYEYAHAFVKKMIATLLKNAALHTEHSRRKIVSVNDLVEAIRVAYGKKFYPIPHADFQKCVSVSSAEERRAAVAGHCVFASKKSFSDLIKYEVKDYGEKLRVSTSFVLHLQYYVEHETIKMLATAVELACEKGKTVLSKHVDFVIRNNCRIPESKGLGPLKKSKAKSKPKAKAKAKAKGRPKSKAKAKSKGRPKSK